MLRELRQERHLIFWVLVTAMTEPIWKDRVWLALVLGPFAWMAASAPFLDLTTVHWGALAAVAFNVNVGLVSMCVPILTRRSRISE
jgi:hypothetical protein